MKSFSNWFNGFIMVLLLTLIIDMKVYAPKHSVNAETDAGITILLTLLLIAIVLRSVFILNRKNKSKR